MHMTCGAHAHDTQCTCGAHAVHMQCTRSACPGMRPHTHLGRGLACVLAVEVEAIECAHELCHPHRLGIVELARGRDGTRELLQ